MSKTYRVQRLDTLRNDLQAARVLRIPWRKIAMDYPGVPPGTLCAIHKGREPKKATIRAALGLPLLLPAPACPHCGAPPHAHRNCPARRNGHGKPGPHRWIVTGRTAADIAASILRQLPADEASRVKELL